MLDEISENVCRSAVAAKFVLRTSSRSPQNSKLTLSRPQINAQASQNAAKSHVTDSAMKTTTVVRTTPKIGRNDPCPCGSGKKYKNCCGRNV